jgi:hypothetical protein
VAFTQHPTARQFASAATATTRCFRAPHTHPLVVLSSSMWIAGCWAKLSSRCRHAASAVTQSLLNGLLRVHAEKPSVPEAKATLQLFEQYVPQ